LVESGVGSGIDAFGRHIAAIRRYNADGDKESVDKAAENLLQSVYFSLEKINPEMIAFAALVTRIDGQERNDLSETGLQATAAELARTGGTFGQFRQIIDAAKKKLARKWSFSFQRRPTTPKRKSTPQA
jgi:hypothetical protein